MRLTHPFFVKTPDPDSWVAAVQRAGCSAGNLPVGPDASDEVVASYVKTAKAADIVIAEVGAWCNPIGCDPAKAREAIVKCQRHLDLAERAGARCCVNITGSRHPSGRGPHPDNFSDETFDMIAQVTREIVDAVKPKRTFYTLETMPWVFPSTPDEYLRLIKAIDRPSIAVHLDPVNMITSPALAYRNADLIRESFAKLGPYIKSCHAKDIILEDKLTVHLDECRPGTGILDYEVFLRELEKLDPDTTLFLEHLSQEDYPIGADYIRGVARQHNLKLK
jgi:sugar phosphate isomerase/epimerase